MTLKLNRFMLVATALLIAAVSAWAQLDTGTIQGSVKDQTGALIPNATVTITNASTQAAHVVRTDSAGEYTLPALPAGQYVVVAVAKGFTVGRVTNVALNASELHRVDVVLKPGAETETVTVTADQVQVNKLSADLGTTIGSDRVSNLPLNGRDFTDLLALVPGSVTSGQFGQTSLGGVETSFAGVNMLLDGSDSSRIDINATSIQLGRESARITRSSVDSIAEFHVLQGNYSAEYGRSIGDVVNVITKSGGNQIHGEAFEFFRNDALDARNYFAQPGASTPLRLNQFGGNLGGPVKKDSLFYFANYEGVRQSITNTGIYDVLNAGERAKFVSSMAPVVAAIPVGNLGPDPNASSVFDLYSANLLNTLREDTGSVRMDWQKSPRSKFYLRYNINDSNTNTTYGPAIGQVAPTPARTQFVKISNTFTFSPNILNELGASLNSNKVESYGGGGNFPTLSVGCFFCNFGVGPGPALFASIRPQTSYEFTDSLTVLRGRNSFKFGADVRNNLSDNILGLQEFLYYGSISDFENNNGFAFSTLGNPAQRIRNSNWDFFAQDDIRLLPSLNVNVGLRYEYNTVLHERDGKLANFDIATQTVGTPGASLYSPTYTNFGPRFGFSWDPYGKSMTVIRGGFGIFYNPSLTGAVFSLTDNTSNNISVNVFQELFGTVTCSSWPLSYPVSSVPTCSPQVRNVDEFDPKTKDSYAYHYSFGIQQQLIPNMVLDISYAGNRGLKLPAGAAFAGLEFNNLNPYTGAYPLSTNFANERKLGDFLNSRYNSLQAALRGRHTHLTYDVNYTWSHEIDDTVNIFSAFNNPTNPNSDFGSGDTDVRHNLTSDVYFHDAVIGHMNNRLGKGWNVGAIFSARTGFPVNILTNVASANGGAQRPELLPNASLTSLNRGGGPNNQLDASIFKSPDGLSPTSTATTQGYDTLGNIPRNAGRGPHFAQLDLSLIKRTPITEKLGTEFRADFFNIANHPNFANPDGNLTDPSFGRSTSTVGNLVDIGTSRQIQFAFKLLF
ncbi:MAG TPA: TonB-dependent receptor [Terracidiphilus sp.]|nr:TonB-dependent receptor [Terracidiphilus sp.]HVC45960.1 TonB-dependent receptor [Terracidiphilus sp.]